MKNWFLLLFALFSFHAVFSCFGQQTTYRCPPCAYDCHDRTYSTPGACIVCGMQLVPDTTRQYEGYNKSIVEIKSDSIHLNAAYYQPKNKERLKGAIVIVHGSAPSTYEDVSFYTRIGVQLGMAVLAFDKRGVGKSGGTYEYFDVNRSKAWFELLASDVLACVQWLKARPELRGTKIGLLGGSQAGWIMPLAASKSNDIDFMVIGEGVSVSAGEEHYFSQLTGDGSGNGISIAEAHNKLKHFSGELGFDPRLILENLDVKTLWFFGTNDPVIPVDASIAVLEKMKNPNFKIVLLPFGDHNFKNTRTDERYDLVGYIEPWLNAVQVIRKNKG